MKKFFILIAVAAMAFAAQAATLSLYDGTEWSNKAPFNGMYFDTAGNKTQVLYPAADLTDIVGKQITGITFYTDENGCPIDGGLLNISLGETDVEVINGYITEGMTQVGTLTFTKIQNTNVEIVITFDTPYTYNGGNLIFENIVAETTGYDNLYCLGVSTSYNNCVVTDFGVTMRQFLPKTTFTYEGGGQEGLSLLAEANALEDNSEFTFDGDAVVTAFFNNYLFLRDESGYAMISGVEGAFANGQVLNQGWNATKTSNNGWVSYTDAAGLSASGETNAELAAAQKLTAFPDESMLNAYVYVENVNLGPFPPRTFKLPDGTSITKSEILGGIGWSMGGNYNVYGVIVKDGGVLKLNPIDSELYVEPEPEVTDKPVITYVDDPEAQTVTVTATGNGHICLYWDDMLQAEGEGTAEWVIAYGDDPEGEEYGISATAQEDGKEVSEYALATVFVPGKPVEPEVLRGDVNKDKTVNIADVTALIDMLLSGAEMIPEADCNLDNVMNIADVTALIDFLLSGQWPN